MAEKENGAAQPQQQQQPPQVKMSILTQYVRDLSFENIMAQRGQGGEVTPDVTVSVNLEPKKRQPDHQYEVDIKLKVDSKNKGDGQALFLMELDYAGVFHIEGLPDEQLHPFLLVECPRLLFPFLRRIVSDVTRDGGFPPLNLENIDFMALYRNELARRQQAAAAAEGADKPQA
ncbi:protein-export chaperone SecB [Roseovarius faecimaris]|uniref:Protein-export protein SecB n=1 Tax=Roseovarius faecimaris TaxID=2494550 RepID=A0A6I6IVE9_9RHOB|nr:protein-export chaperone SecB [Roseovarius faecimaris]QGY00153.1 protein-export chaperone SecB [Roseovarius faecimaris]